MTTRSVLKGIGAELILPSAWDRFANHLENRRALLRRPRHVEDVLYVFNNGAEDYRVGLNQADYEWPDPDMTIKNTHQNLAMIIGTGSLMRITRMVMWSPNWRVGCL